jgi:small GTP-binding protein
VPARSAFLYDVFLSYSKEEVDQVRDIAHKLKADGVRVWFDEWESKASQITQAKIEVGLEQSHALLLCMSAAAFGSDWPRLENHTFRFRDPLHQDRRFIPLRLDRAPIKDALASIPYIDWQAHKPQQEYAKLLASCRVQNEVPDEEAPPVETLEAEETIQLHYEGQGILHYAFSPDGKRAISGDRDHRVRLWDLKTGRCLESLKGHTDIVSSVAWSADHRYALSSSYDKTVRLWDFRKEECIDVFRDHFMEVSWAVFSSDHRLALSASDDRTLRLWDVKSGRCLQIFVGHRDNIWAAAFSPDDRQAISVSDDHTLRLWDTTSGRCVRVLEGHSGPIWHISWSSNGRYALSSGSTSDPCIRLWDVETGDCQAVLQVQNQVESSGVLETSWHPNSKLALSCSEDHSVRLWDIDRRCLLAELVGHTKQVKSVAWHADQKCALLGDRGGNIYLWDLTKFVTQETAKSKFAISKPQQPSEQVSYTNAKVLLVGNSGVGKTALSNRLTLDSYQKTDSTVGALATRWTLPPSEGLAKPHGERDIWLWDFGGQADQRLIHQLYMDQTQVAVLVFDPKRLNVLERLATWDHDLNQAATGDFKKLLVAGRIDEGGLRSVSREQMEHFAREHGYAGYIETSSKEASGCDALKQAICDLIDWDEIAQRTTPRLFQRLKQEIVALKEEGQTLMRFKELRDTLSMRMRGVQFSDQELRTVIRLLAGPGVVWELGFGSWVLLAPDLMDAYAQAVIRTTKEDNHELGCITEEEVFAGQLSYPTNLKRLPHEEERILLIAVHRLLLEKNLCLSKTTDNGNLLIFPSYARRERFALISHPSVQVSYQFEGFLDDTYATLVVHLHRLSPFTTIDLWYGAADFETKTGEKLGIKLIRKASGKAELLVHFDPEIPVEERMIFSDCIQEHLYRKAKDRSEVKRLRHWTCPHCGEPVENRARAMQRLADKGSEAKIICVNCEKYVYLWDAMEKTFANPETKRKRTELEVEADRELDIQNKERALVGDIISTVTLAGQIIREFSVSNHGIDMEIEFKDDTGQATGKRMYLILKLGETQLTHRQEDGTDIFKIPTPEHAEHWMSQAYPVMLVHRDSGGSIRWMEISSHLRDLSNNGKKQVRQLIFKGETFDVMSVRRWRDKALNLI